MALNANNLPKKKTESKRVPQPNLEVGGHPARLVQVIDLGLQPQRPYKGTEKEPVNMLYVTYEMSDDFMIDEDGNEQTDLPRWLSEDFPFYSLDADKAKSTERYNALDPKREQGGDWSKLLGAACTVLVVHNPDRNDPNKVYDNVGSVTAAAKIRGYEQPPLVNPPVFFDLDNPSLEVFSKLPTFLQDRIKNNLNYNGSELQKLLGEAPKAPSEAPAQEPESVENPY